MAPSLAAAGGIHLGLAAQHGLASQHGALFHVAGLSQAALAVTASRRLAPWTLIAAVGLSAGIISAWLVTTLPAVITHGEPLGALEQVAAALEATTVAFGLVLMRRGVVARARQRLEPLALSAAAMVGATATMVGATSHAEHHSGAHGDGNPQTVCSTAQESEPVFGDLFADHHGDHHDCGPEHAASGPVHRPPSPAARSGGTSLTLE